MTDPADLEQELRALGRTLLVEPPSADLAERVLARVQGGHHRNSRVAGWWRWVTRSRRRLVAVIVAAVILGLALTPPVRAAVAHWLHIGGVLIKTGAPPPEGSLTPEPIPTSGRRVTLSQARRMVSFPVSLPAALGDPDLISVSNDRRVVSMDWRDGPKRIHLDQFDGTLSWVFIKRAWRDIEPVDVAGRDGVWFPSAHPIVFVDRDGTERSQQARIAGPSLVWEQPVAARLVTFRLEGELTKDGAIALAQSVG